MGDIFDEFANALRFKFYRALEKDDKRSKEPWKDHDSSWLLSRLEDERVEYLKADGDIEKAKESIDIAEFAMFLWKRHILLLNEIDDKKN